MEENAKFVKAAVPEALIPNSYASGSAVVGHVSEVRKCNATVPSGIGLASAWSGLYKGNTCQLDHILCG